MLQRPRLGLGQSFGEPQPDTDRPGDRGAVESGPNLFSIYGSAAFQLAFGAEERGRADVSELLYSGRRLSTRGCKETI